MYRFDGARFSLSVPFFLLPSLYRVIHGTDTRNISFLLKVGRKYRRIKRNDSRRTGFPSFNIHDMQIIYIDSSCNR